MSITKPTVLFVHGSWHQPQHFESVRSVFSDEGYSTECPALASTNAKPCDGINWLAADAEVIRETASRLVNEGKDVIVVMHSYGGVVGSEAIHEDLGKKIRELDGQKGGVTDLVYLCAFVLSENQSIASTLGQLPPYIKLNRDGTCCMLEPEKHLFHDLSDSDKKKYISLLAPVPTKTQFARTTYAAYKYFPSTYLYCTNDKALLLQYQKMMVQKNGGGVFETEKCEAGHSPYLSLPKKVLEVVMKLESQETFL